MSEWASERASVLMNEFIGGYKVDVSKFKRCLMLITVKLGQNIF